MVEQATKLLEGFIAIEVGLGMDDNQCVPFCGEAGGERKRGGGEVVGGAERWETRRAD